MWLTCPSKLVDIETLRFAAILRVEDELQLARAGDDKVCGPVLVPKGMPGAHARACARG